MRYRSLAVGIALLLAEAASGTGGGPSVNAGGAVLGVNGFLLQSGAGLAPSAAEFAIVARGNDVAFAAAPACNG